MFSSKTLEKKKIFVVFLKTEITLAAKDASNVQSKGFKINNKIRKLFFAIKIITSDNDK